MVLWSTVLTTGGSSSDTLTIEDERKADDDKAELRTSNLTKLAEPSAPRRTDSEQSVLLANRPRQLLR